MKKLILSIIFLNLLCVNLFSHVKHYKDFNYLEYELYRNNQLIGYHKYEFIRKNGELNVKSVVNFKITKLNIDLYKYSAKSEERYKNGIFHSFSSKTIQNKKTKFVDINANKEKNLLNVNGSSFKGETNINNIVGTWWNHEIINADAQISAISGRVLEQEVTFLGKETVSINDKQYKALKFNFKSSDETLPDNKKLNTNIWYDEKSMLWLKASFKKRGNWEYRIKTVR